MVETAVFVFMFSVCAVIGLPLLVAGVVMATVDMRSYGLRRSANLEMSRLGKNVTGDVLLTSVGITMVVGGIIGVLSIVGIV